MTHYNGIEEKTSISKDWVNFLELCHSTPLARLGLYEASLRTSISTSDIASARLSFSFYPSIFQSVIEQKFRYRAQWTYCVMPILPPGKACWTLRTLWKFHLSAFLLPLWLPWFYGSGLQDKTAIFYPFFSSSLPWPILPLLHWQKCILTCQLLVSYPSNLPFGEY